MSSYLKQLGLHPIPDCCRSNPRYGKIETVVEVEQDLRKNGRLDDAISGRAHFDNYLLKSYGPGHLYAKIHNSVLTVVATRCFDRSMCDRAHGYQYPTICMKPQTSQENADWTTIRRWLDQAEEDYLMGK